MRSLFKYNFIIFTTFASLENKMDSRPKITYH